MLLRSYNEIARQRNLNKKRMEITINRAARLNGFLLIVVVTAWGGVGEALVCGAEGDRRMSWRLHERRMHTRRMICGRV
jgi:hypothetical protein